MPTYRRFKATPDAVAIYDVETREPNIGNEPFTDPLSHVSKLHFHSSLRYPGIVSTVRGNLSLPAVSAGTFYEDTYNIHVHGLSGAPYVEGVIYLGGQWVTMAGSVPIDQDVGGSPDDGSSFARFLNLGSSETRVLFHEYSITHSSYGGYAAQTIPYVIYVTDYIMS